MEKNFQNNKIEHVYIHIPFCLKKCSYCSFFSTGFKIDKLNIFLATLLKEIKLYSNFFRIKPKTIYFGGGTPSLLKPYQINEILSLFELSDTSEITLEANPITLTEQYIGQLAKTKINRISLGLQSLDDNELKLLGRLHDSKTVYSVVNMLQNKGFTNLSFDLIYGLPKQTTEKVILSLKKMIELNPKHISIYCLTLEEDVPMYKMINKLPKDEIIAEMYQALVSILSENRFFQYEISNFSKLGFESTHNTAYWSNKYYLGLGPSAAGYIKNYRYQNPSNLQTYINQINNNKILPSSIFLTKKQLMEEYLFLGLRKSEGILLEDFIYNFGKENLEKYLMKLSEFIESGHLIKTRERLYLSPISYFISNEIFSSLL